jgi:hypothetical protein
MSETKPLTVPQYEHMANELQIMSDMIRARPEMNHNFAQRLQTLSREMRDDEARAHPEVSRR